MKRKFRHGKTNGTRKFTAHTSKRKKIYYSLRRSFSSRLYFSFLFFLTPSQHLSISPLSHLIPFVFCLFLPSFRFLRRAQNRKQCIEIGMSKGHSDGMERAPKRLCRVYRLWKSNELNVRAVEYFDFDPNRYSYAGCASNRFLDIKGFIVVLCLFDNSYFFPFSLHRTAGNEWFAATDNDERKRWNTLFELISALKRSFHAGMRLRVWAG